jgi:small subunit ribosomal protein S17
MAKPRAARRIVVGRVVSDRMQKTITVAEERLVRHAAYGKYLRRSVTYKAHDEHGEARMGDEVEIAFTRPQSKTKNWRLVRVVRRGREEAVRGEEDREAAAPPPKRKPAPPPVDAGTVEPAEGGDA